MIRIITTIAETAPRCVEFESLSRGDDPSANEIKVARLVIDSLERAIGREVARRKEKATIVRYDTPKRRPKKKKT